MKRILYVRVDDKFLKKIQEGGVKHYVILEKLVFGCEYIVFTNENFTICCEIISIENSVFLSKGYCIVNFYVRYII